MPLKSLIRTIPDYPKPGIQFRDITTPLRDPVGFQQLINNLSHPFTGKSIDTVAGIEARGFIIGSAVAHQLSVGFIPVRKRGKLPNETIGQDYELEYGNDRVEIHRDAISPGEKVLLIDDLLAYRRDCDSHSEPPPPHGGRRRSVWIRYKPARARGPKAPRKRRCARPDPY